MKSMKKIKLLIITGLLLQSSINLARNNNTEEESLSFISAAGRGNLKDIKIALDNPQINVNYQCGGIEGRNDVGRTALMEAALWGQTEVVSLLLKAGANPNMVDKSQLRDCELAYNFDIPKGGNTALMNAVTKGHVKVVTLLLEAGADPNIKTLDGTPPLMNAAQFKSRNDVEIVSILLSCKADPNIKRDKRNIVTFRPQADWTVLMYATDIGHTEVVKLLLEAGAHPNIQDDDSLAALKIAANKGHTEIVRLLLKAGANPNIKNKHGATALMAAADNGHVDVVKELLDEKSYKPNMNVIEKVYNLFSKNKAINIDLNATNNHGMSALMWAANKGHAEIVRLLLDAGADSNIKDYDFHRTALHYAGDCPHYEKRQEMVQLIKNAQKK